jgi:4-amino-4-deoxy-L-arabinose transferase-like glycosyltransferase
VTSSSHQRTKILFLLVLLACSWVFFFLNLGSYSLKEPDEGRYAEIPREMLETGDYLVPHLNYVRYFEKPPLLYWMTAAFYKPFGVSEWSFRLPNALIALFCVLITYVFAARSWGARMGLISALILASSFGFFAMARVVTVDMLFAFLLFASLLCFCQFYRAKKSLFLYLFYAALALAVLAKGPVAIVLLAATIILFLLSERRLSSLRDFVSPGGLLLFGVIAAPWFVVMSVKEKEFFQFFFIDQHVLRFLTSKHNRSGPIYYFLPVLFGGLFPWSVFIPRAAVRLWRVRDLRPFFIWSVVVFAFFSLSGSKLPTYILPIYPAVALILGYLFDRCWHDRIQRNREVVVYAAFFSCVAVAGLAYVSGLLTLYLTVLPDAGAPSGGMRSLSVCFGLISLGMLALLSFKRTRIFSHIFCALCFFSLLVVASLMAYVSVIDGVNTTKMLAREIDRRAKADAIVVNYGSYDETLPFYLGRRTYVAEYTGELAMGANYTDAKPFFLSRDEFTRMVRSEKPVFVVMKAKRLPLLESLDLSRNGIIGREDQRVLIANRSALVN